MPEIKFMETVEKTVDSKKIVESMYIVIKNLAKNGSIKSEDVEAIAGLTTELANRLKVEEADGEPQD